MMKRCREFLVVAFLVVTMVLGIQSVSQATLTMALWDNTAQTGVLIVDGGLGDTSAITGAIAYSGSVGNWMFNVTGALSKPVMGSAGNPQMDLVDLSYSGPTGGVLWIGIMDTGFTGPLYGGSAGPFKLDVGGTTSGQVNFYALGQTTNNNTIFADYFDAVKFAYLGPFSSSDGKPAPFSGTNQGSFKGANNEFALGIWAEIVHRGFGATSFDASLTTVPVPAAFWLLGSGILGLVGFRRKMVA
jgi:type IV secretory pathway VirB2 component (pilin)